MTLHHSGALKASVDGSGSGQGFRSLPRTSLPTNDSDGAFASPDCERVVRPRPERGLSVMQAQPTPCVRTRMWATRIPETSTHSSV